MKKSESVRFVVPKKKVILESKIEGDCKDRAESRGHAAYKFTSPSMRSVPDRLHLAPIPECLQPLFAKYIAFVEYKRTGEDATEEQKREHARLRALGFRVEVIDSVEKGEIMIDSMGSSC